MILAQVASRALRCLDPETAHHLALRGLDRFGAVLPAAQDDPALACRTLGLTFKNPIGLAAGFDKDAVALPGLARLGFGLIEAGTVTPRPQPGNPRPRLFRLVEDGAAINRLGFNNAGIDQYLARLRTLGPRGSRQFLVPVGANLGINKEGADPERDYAALAKAVAPYADYIVVNLSSPNTPGLRDLQSEARLRAILAAIGQALPNAALPNRPPLLVKVAPDLSTDGLQAAVETCIDAGVDGMIVSNTTLSRPDTLRSPHRAETGGLSGRPLFALSTAMLARAAGIARGRLVLIGVGGIESGADILTKIEAGATLVQLYTAFAYQGPALLPRLKTELLAALRQRGHASLAAAIGARTDELAQAALKP